MNRPQLHIDQIKLRPELHRLPSRFRDAPATSLRYATLVVVVAIVYLAAAKLGLSLAFLHVSVSPIWPPSGIAIAAVLLFGHRVLPGILVAALVANLGTGEPVVTATGIAIGNTLEAASAAFLLHRFVGNRSPLNSPRDVLRFVLIAGVFSPALGATIGNASLCLGGAADWRNFGSLWLTWWLGDGSGALIVAPFLLSWIEEPYRRWSRRSLLEAALLLFLLSVVAFTVFGGSLLPRVVNYPVGHLTIPFLLWAALRFGPCGASSAIVVLSTIATWGTTRGFGPFVENNTNESLLMLQVFVVALAIATLFLGAVVVQYQRAQTDLTLLASIVESTDDAVVGKTLDGTIISWNRGAERIYGYAPDEIIGRSVSVLIPSDRVDDLARNLQRLEQGDRIERHETVRVRKDGRRIDASVTISPIRDASGNVVAASTIARDITERKQREVERELLLRSEKAARLDAESANRAKDEFFAIVSHELRTPLNAILGWVNILMSDHVRDEALTARGLEVISRNARLQKGIIGDLLDVSRIIAGKLPLDIHEIDLQPIIQAAISAIQPSAEAKGIHIEQRLDPIDRVRGDSTRLQQVVWNLLSNAIKFTPVAGKVKVRLEQIGFSARITVTDTGEGIAPEFLPHIFDRFRQADSSSTRRYGGLGLGLAIVRHLAELHGGTVEAFSGGLNQGATFSVTVPCAVARFESDTEERPITGEGGGASDEVESLEGLVVLVVEDDADSRDALVTLLTLKGATVKSASSVAEALRILSESRPDVLVSDIGMPDEDGYVLIRKLRALSPADGGTIPAIALTGFAASHEAEYALSIGYQMHLSKPVEPARLIAAIARLGMVFNAKTQGRKVR